METDIRVHRTPCEDESRSQDNISTGQETSKSTCKPLETKIATWNRFLLAALNRN